MFNYLYYLGKRQEADEKEARTYRKLLAFIHLFLLHKINRTGFISQLKLKKQ